MNVKRFIRSMRVSIFCIAMTILLKLIDLGIRKEIDIEPLSIVSVQYDLLIVSFGILLGLHYSIAPEIRGRLVSPLFWLCACIVLVLALQVMAASPWGNVNNQEWLTIWLPNILGISTVGWTVLTVMDIQR